MSLTSYRAAPPRAIRFLPWGKIPWFLSLAKAGAMNPSGSSRLASTLPLQFVSCSCGTGSKKGGFAGVPYWFRAFACYEKIVLRFADLAATYSPAS